MEDVKWLSDAELIKRIGGKIKEWRLEANKSQKEVANEARLSLITYQNIEHGRGASSLASYVRILRVLDHLDAFNVFLEEKPISPILFQRIEEGMKVRQRASKRRSDDKDDDSIPVW